MVIRPSSDIRNNYPEISRFCKEAKEPVFLTSNGNGDIVVMSIEEYSQMKKTIENQAKQIALLEDDLDTAEKLIVGYGDIVDGRTIPFEEFFNSLDEKIANKKKKGVQANV